MKKWISSFSYKAIDVLLRLVIFATPLVWVFGKGDHYYFSIYDIFKEAFVESAAAMIAGFFLLKLFCDEKPVKVKYSPLFWTYLCFFGVILLSMTQAFNLHESLIFVRRWAANLTIFTAVAHMVSNRKYLRAYLNTMFVSATLVSVYGICQHFGIDFPQLHQNFTGNSTFGNPNFASEYILIVFPIALMLLFAPMHMAQFVIYLIMAAAMFFYLILNKSRAVWIGGGFAGVITTVYFAVNYFKHGLQLRFTDEQKKHTLFVFKLFVATVFVLVSLIFISFAPQVEKNPFFLNLRNMTNVVLKEAASIKEIKVKEGEIRRGDTAAQRLLIWRNSLNMVLRSPKNSILGVGIGNYKIRYQPYRTKDEQIATGPDIFVRRSHNEYVQFLAELGLFGIMFFFALIFISIRMSSRILKNSGGFYGQCFGLGMMLSLISFYIAIFFNFSLQTPTPCITFSFVLGLLMAGHELFLKEEIESEYLSNVANELQGSVRYLLPVAAVLFLIMPIWLVRPALAYYSYQYGQALEKMGLKYNSKLELQKSLKFFYPSWETHFVLANVHAALGDLLEAKKEHEISLSLNPYHQKGHYNFANTIYKLGEAERAIEHYKKAVEIDKVFYQGFNNLGSVYFKEKSVPNHLEKSLECFKKVVELKPDYPSGQYNIGYILYLLGRYKEAIPYVQEAYRLKPNDPKVRKLAAAMQQLFNKK